MCEVKNPYLRWSTTTLWPEFKKDIENSKFYIDAWSSVATLIPVVPEIERVIFHGPATIIFWSDNTKTIVKCMDGEEFDEEKGIAMAFMKKLYGTGYMRKIRRHIPVRLSAEEKVNVES